MNLGELKNHALKFDRATFVEPLWGGENKDVELKGYRAVWNVDKKRTASIVSERYNIVQHQEVVDAVVTAVSNLNLKADCRVRDNGNSIFVDLTFADKPVNVKKGEEFFAGIRIINSYNKTTGIVVAPRMLRCICSNGMVVDKIISGYNIMHTKKLTEDFQSIVERLVNKMVNSVDKFREIVEDCIGDSIEWEMLDKILKNLSGAEKHLKGIKGLLPENPTRWDVYNAFTEYATHGTQIKPNVEQRLQMTSQKLLTTPLQALVPKPKEE